MNSKLAITCGDPAGVGPEIIADWIKTAAPTEEEIALIGPARWLASVETSAKKISVGLDDYESIAGEPNADGSLVAWAAMERAAAGCRLGEFSGVVTGPVSKDRLARIGYGYPGQTEFFAARWGGMPVMAFCGGRLRVVLATWHVPLRLVADLIDESLLRRTALAAVELARSEGVAEPRVAVCGLNPHAGENGLLGSEEQERLNPALTRIQQEIPRLSLCEPGDTVFHRALQGEFDVVVALYHDQGLAPLKAIDFDQAVNVTLGLPFIRTSPDHGTAYALAGKGLARVTSFANAVAVARRLINARAGR
jgi:4-hydroxythreonine-4-phosphate dehydrogenase